jgi:tetratricopeptide (TPR) repeat protein
MCGRLLWLAGLLVWTTRAAEPPQPAATAPAYQRLLQGADARKAKELGARMAEHLAAGRFEEAVRTAEAAVALRRRVQGADHWQTTDARWLAEQLRRMSKQDADGRRGLTEAASWVGVANMREALGWYHEAQPLREKLLAIKRKVLGEDDPVTGSAYYDLGLNLHSQGKYGAALPMYEKALAICRKALGEEHPGTALMYNSVATGLHAQGKYAAAQPLFEKALAIRRRVLGEYHADTTLSYNNLAGNLNSQGHYAAAQPLYEKALAAWRKSPGEGHATTGVGYSNVATNLDAQGKHAAAQPLHEKALTILRRALGEGNRTTALSYNNLAYNLDLQGMYTAAQPGLEKALALNRKLLGDGHPDTARSYANLAYNLTKQGRYAAAQPLFEKSLAILRQALGEDHTDTAMGYTNLAGNLNDQGRYAAAQGLFEKALAINRQALGEGHATTALCYNNVAGNLNDQGRYAAAQGLFENALAIRRKALGDGHPDTAAGYLNLADNLEDQGQFAAAQRLYEKALAINRKALGEGHPDTAIAYNNSAVNLCAQGNYTAAQPLFETALGIRRQALGEEHPATADAYDDLAANLYARGRFSQAEDCWAMGAAVFARVRLRVAASGLGRATAAGRHDPLPRLAAVLARNGKPEEAWRRFEESLARGTWDDLSARLRRSPAERDRQTALGEELRRLDRLIERTFVTKETPELKARREALLTQRRNKGDDLAVLTERLEKEHGPVAGQVYERTMIQKALPADAALIGWVDIEGQPKAANPDGEHWAVVLRAQGTPAWQRLRGSGKDGSWTEADTRLLADLRRALREPSRDRQATANRLRVQRLQPVAGALAGGDGLPAARRLIVLPSHALAGVPLEVCTPDYTVSYAPSGTIFAYLRQLAPADGRGMLALADPVFDPGKRKPGPTPLPPGGVLVTMVVPNGSAARARLRADDVLLRYAGSDVQGAADLGRLIQQHAEDKEVRVAVWRAGRAGERIIPGGPLGVALARQPAPQALAERAKNDALLAHSGTGMEGVWPELPGTRVEVKGLGRLCGAAKLPFRLLADSDASEQELDRLAGSKDLASYRYIHLATHGDLDDRLPLQSAVILARDRLPDLLKQLEAGQPVYDGRLTAEKVLERWDLHTDLVTLSACETALGKYEGGEGFVGFTQALLLSGARSVCLSLWKVDDTATALLMQRFYANLLGQRPGLKKPLGKAEALAEAKDWLRNLTAAEAARQAASLTQGVARGKGRKPLPRLPAVNGAAAKAAKPYAHPYYWAASVLVGDAD